MSRYIDADALKQSIENRDICDICADKRGKCSYDCAVLEVSMPEWENLIDAQPNIDIVRCKECIHNPWDFDRTDYTCVWDDDFADRPQTPNDFCSYGEREGE